MSAKKRIMMIRPGKRFPRMGFAQPLGLLSLIGILRKHYPGEFEVDLVEQALYDLSVDQMRSRILSFQPDLVLMSCLTVEGNEMRELCALSKSLFPEVPVWIGGPHATFFYDWELETGNVDAVCIGEGEETFREMIGTWLAGRGLDQVPGLAIRGDGQIITTAPRPPIDDIDSLPLPAWDMVDFKKYALQTSMNAFVKNAPWSLFFSTRACPYQCIYCHSIFGKKVRKRSVENVMTEIELLYHEHGVRELHIVDDIFNLDLERAKAICDEIVRRNLKITIAFPNGLRADRMDRELIQKLKAAGCYSITYAVETASPRLQKLIKKNLDLDKAREVISWSDEEGLIPQAFFMLGFPTETREELQMTIDYAKGSRLMRAWFFTVVVYPRTGLYELAKAEYPDFEIPKSDFFKLRYWSDEPFYTRVSGIDIYKVQRDAYRAFFVRPSVVVRILMRFPKNRWLLRGLYTGIRSIFTSLTNLELKVRPLFKKFTDRFKLLGE